MKKLITIGLVCFTLGLAGTAQAQMTSTTQKTMANGAVRTTTKIHTVNGSASTHTIDRPDGSRTVVRRQTEANGDTRSVRRERGSDMVRVCHSRWSHGHRVRRCYNRRR